MFITKRAFWEARKVGLSPIDIARLCGVSRVAASLWLNGHHSPHRLLHDRVVAVLAAISAARAAGDLPVPADLCVRSRRQERSEYIQSTIDAHSVSKKITS